MWLDYAEDQANRRRPIYMSDWRERMDDFLQFNQRAILEHSGHISKEEARRRAQEQYEIFNQRQIEDEDALAEQEFEQNVKKLLPSRKEGDL